MVRQNVGYPTNFAFFATSHEVVGISDRCDRTGSSSSESGGGVTGTQHAPVESQIERVSSVSAQLAPDRYAELSWHQADAQTATRQTERPLRGLLSSCTRVHGGHCLFARSLVYSDSEPSCLDLKWPTCESFGSAQRRRFSTGNCTQRRDCTSSEHSILTPSVS